MFGYLVNEFVKINYIKKLYKEKYDELKETRNFWAKVLEYFNITFSVNYIGDIPNKGSVIIVSNHPYGLLDGLIISSIVSNIRTDYKILINEEITQIDLIKKYLLPIKFSEITEDIKGNIKSKKNAIKFVNDGGLLILFPSGEVATSKFIFDQPKERDWKPLVGSIVKKTECKIIPVNFRGKNSFLFQTVGFLSDKLRRVLFVRELLNKSNNNFSLTIGKNINSKKFIDWNNSRVADYLKKKVLELN
jgi:putative hemolysin